MSSNPNLDLSVVCCSLPDHAEHTSDAPSHHPMASSKSMHAARPEFQVVILAGGGSHRMMPLTQRMPKALLPIANQTLLGIQLRPFERRASRSNRRDDRRSLYGDKRVPRGGGDGHGCRLGRCRQ